MSHFMNEANNTVSFSFAHSISFCSSCGYCCCCSCFGFCFCLLFCSVISPSFPFSLSQWMCHEYCRYGYGYGMILDKYRFVLVLDAYIYFILIPIRNQATQPVDSDCACGHIIVYAKDIVKDTQHYKPLDNRWFVACVVYSLLIRFLNCTPSDNSHT